MLISSAIEILIFMWVGTPKELTINLDEKTYRIKSGWPYLQKCWDGSLQDVARLMVAYSNSNMSLIVLWKPMKRWKTQPSRFTIGRYSSRPQAEAVALRIMEEWDINVPINEPGSRTVWIRKT